MQRQYLVGAGLLHCLLVSCGPPEEQESTHATHQRISLGEPVPINIAAAVGVAVINPATGQPETQASGGLLAPKVVLTAGHVIDANSSHFVFLEDQGSIDEAAFATNFFFHPTFGSEDIPDPYQQDPFETPTLPGEESVLCKSMGLDLGILFLEQELEASNATLPRQFHVESSSNTIVDQTDAVTMYGYGNPDLGEARKAVGTAVGKHDIKMPGNTLASVVGFGYHVDFSFRPGIGKPQAGGGDSGAPVVVNATDRNLAVHSCADIALPNGGTATGGFNPALEPVDSWLNAMIFAGQQDGLVVVTDYNQKGRADHVIIFEDDTGVRFFIELGEGCDPNIFGTECGGNTVDLGPLSELVLPDGTGSFDAVPFADAVVINDGIAFQVLNLHEPLATPLPGTFDYEQTAVVRLNADQFDDLQATGSGGTEFYFGGPGGLTGPFEDGGGVSCRAVFSTSLANACGGRAPGSECWCDALCIANGDCCGDFSDTCLDPSNAELLVDTAIGIASDLANAVTEPVIDVDTSAPAVTLATAGGEGHGVFVDEAWILTSADIVAGQQPSEIAAASFDGTAVPIQASLVDESHGVALLRATPPSGVVPAGHELPLYPGSAAELALEAGFQMFGSDPLTSELVSAALPGGRALVRPQTTTNLPLEFRLGHAPGLDSELQLRRGSPVVTQNGFLAGITAEAQTDVLRVRDPLGAEQDVQLVTESIVPLLLTNHAPSDRSPSARYWIQQTRRRERLRDANSDGLHDLWGSSNGSQLVSLPLSDNVANPPSSAAPELDRTGNWRYVGRVDMKDTTAIWWREIDTGEVEIWQMDGTARSAVANFFVDPTWKVASFGDINGDGVDDVIWSNEAFALYFFWLLNPIQAFGATIADLAASAGAAIVAYGQWFGALDPEADPASIEIVGAEYFAPQSQLDVLPETGKEQAAVDLVFRPQGSEALLLWEMEVFHRPCSEIGNDLIVSTCASAEEVLLTYELGRNMVWLPPQPPHWSLVGIADYNLDGSADLAWHASGSEAPVEEFGRVQLWLSTLAGDFEPVLLDNPDGTPLVLDPSQFTLNGK